MCFENLNDTKSFRKLKKNNIYKFVMCLRNLNNTESIEKLKK